MRLRAPRGGLDLAARRVPASIGDVFRDARGQKLPGPRRSEGDGAAQQGGIQIAHIHAVDPHGSAVECHRSAATTETSLIPGDGQGPTSARNRGHPPCSPPRME